MHLWALRELLCASVTQPNANDGRPWQTCPGNSIQENFCFYIRHSTKLCWSVEIVHTTTYIIISLETAKQPENSWVKRWKTHLEILLGRCQVIAHKYLVSPSILVECVTLESIILSLICNSSFVFVVALESPCLRVHRKYSTNQPSMGGMRWLSHLKRGGAFQFGSLFHGGWFNVQ
jgi:hypothetical protein